MNSQKKRLKPTRFIKKYFRLIVGSAILAVVLTCAICAPLLTEYDPMVSNLSNIKQPPNDLHIFGTDKFGRDIFSRICYGSRSTLIVAFGAQLVAMVGGTLLGLLCGYYTKMEKFLMRILDAMNTIPSLILCLLMVNIFGAGTLNLILAMSIGGIPGNARMIRNQVLSLREKEYIESEKAMGARDLRTLFVHILPACSSYLIVSFTSGLAGATLSMTSLSFLGLGLDPTIPSWGGMINEAQVNFFGYPHTVLFPALAISITIFGFTLVGDAVRDLLDPKLR